MKVLAAVLVSVVAFLGWQLHAMRMAPGSAAFAEARQMEDQARGILDTRRVFELYEMAAKQGHVEARIELAMRAATGRGTDPSLDEAMRHVRVAFDQGDPDAETVLMATWTAALAGCPKAKSLANPLNIELEMVEFEAEAAQAELWKNNPSDLSVAIASELLKAVDEATAGLFSATLDGALPSAKWAEIEGNAQLPYYLDRKAAEWRLLALHASRAFHAVLEEWPTGQKHAEYLAACMRGGGKAAQALSDFVELTDRCSNWDEFANLSRSKAEELERIETAWHKYSPIKSVHLGLLAAPALFAQATHDAHVGKIKADLRAIALALDAFVISNGRYPEAIEALVRADDYGRTFLNQHTVPKDPWGNEYLYNPPGARNNEFELFTFGRDESAGGIGMDRDISYAMVRDGDL